MEIIPAIDLRGGNCVRLRQGDYSQETVFGDDPAEMAMRWKNEGATRLHLVDLDGAKEGRPVNVAAIRQIVTRTGLPCQLGGGLRSEATIRQMLDDVGIDRVIIGTKALKEPAWFEEMAKKFPNRLVLGIDARKSMVATEGWLEVSQMSALELARRYAPLPIAAIIYTNIANDGMMQGIDGATIDDLCQLSDLGRPVIASGGVTTIADIHNLIAAEMKYPLLNGAIVGRALYEGTISLPEAIRTAEYRPG